MHRRDLPVDGTLHDRHDTRRPSGGERLQPLRDYFLLMLVRTPGIEPGRASPRDFKFLDPAIRSFRFISLHPL
jgi:hypothetical protein